MGHPECTGRQAFRRVFLQLSRSDGLGRLLRGRPDRDRLRGFDRPVLLLAGAADPFCPLPDLRALGRKLPNATLEIVKQTDHFFWRREPEAAEIVGAFAEANLFGS